MTFVYRFFIGGLVVGSVPIVARQLSPRVAGVVVLVPVVTLLSFGFLGRDQGIGSVAKASGAAIVALPAVLGFLVGVHWVARKRGHLSTALLVGALFWLAVAVPVSLVLYDR